MHRVRAQCLNRVFEDIYDVDEKQRWANSSAVERSRQEATAQQLSVALFAWRREMSSRVPILLTASRCHAFES